MGNPIVRYEAGQTAYPFEALTDSGDHAVFVASFSPISNAAGSEPVVAPYGLLTVGRSRRRPPTTWSTSPR